MIFQLTLAGKKWKRNENIFIYTRERWKNKAARVHLQSKEEKRSRGARLAGRMRRCQCWHKLFVTQCKYFVLLLWYAVLCAIYFSNPLRVCAPGSWLLASSVCFSGTTRSNTTKTAGATSQNHWPAATENKFDICWFFRFPTHFLARPPPSSLNPPIPSQLKPEKCVILDLNGE